MNDLKIFTTNIEQEAINQIELLLSQEAFKDCKIRIMPDVHAGTGCVIGFTGNLGDKVIPEIVGFDIGCGMLTVELGKCDIDLKLLDEYIKEKIPSGRNIYSDEKVDEINIYKVEKMIEQLYCKDKLSNIDWLKKSLGTLGGGNHFIEIDTDEDGKKYLIIHTGSRNLGKQVAEIYQDIAIKNCSFEKEKQEEIKNLIADYKLSGRQKEIEEGILNIRNKYNGLTKLPKDLCYLEGVDRENYLHDMKICQEFANWNRKIIAENILAYLHNYQNCDLSLYEYNYFDTIHNYISFEDNIVRKGAIEAYDNGKLLLIPMNMRDGCIIAKGKGNKDWNCSAPHGAGRIMSRVAAKKNLDVKEFEKSMENIYTTTANELTIDEAPMAYKPAQEIIDNIKDTVEIIKIIKPIYNFKATE